MAQGALPGRVGNLTAEQEEKLKEFWVATLQVFGVLEKDANGHADPGANGRTRADTGGSGKKDKDKKKKRMSLFRRGHADDSESIASHDSSHTGSSDSDDKYGQTKEFHDAIATLTPESLRATFWSMVKHDHPDALLLRFLRARKWDVERALIMMISTMRWRASDVHVDDDIMKNGELAALDAANGDDKHQRRLGEDFLAQMRMGKSYLHGLDKEGRPMCFVRARLHKQGEQSEESLERYTVFTIETARMILTPPTDTACVVFDMTGFSLANMDYAPVKFMIKCFEANYPESLGVVLVHKAPWVFQGIWKIIRGWLDPVVASKVQFTNNNQEMEEYVQSNHIIKELDGAEDWAYKYIEPVPGENDKMKDTATRDKLLKERELTVDEYEKSTLEWVHSTSEDVSSIKDTRHKIANTLRDGYWVLDPYVRAKSYYDRVGMIQPSGRPQFYPEPTSTASALAPLPNGTAKPIETSTDDLD
ncbi:CRAL-TRIO domain-containing protein [Tricladium varicosporioides]|nr:CRAL-TRIO domain-containing protein [Hymenoscyphus varicosporioides]